MARGAISSRFGGRCYSACLPCSDLGIVSVMPSEVCDLPGLRPKELLTLVFHDLKESPQCTATEKAIKLKRAVRFTARHGSSVAGHTPSELSCAMRQWVNEQPPLVCDTLMLAKDACTRHTLCYDGQGAIGKRLETVHIVLLGVAWWICSGFYKRREGQEAWHLLCDFCRWIAQSDFKHVQVQPFVAHPLSQRAFSSSTPLELICPRGDAIWLIRSMRLA